jgi:hypothetical protein
MVMAPVIAPVPLALLIPVPVLAVVNDTVVPDAAASAARSASSAPARKGGVGNAKNKQQGQQYGQGFLQGLFIFSTKLESSHKLFLKINPLPD